MAFEFTSTNSKSSQKIPDCEEAYYQIRVDVLRIPEDENKDLEQSAEENIFTYIKKSREYGFY